MKIHPRHKNMIEARKILMDAIVKMYDEAEITTTEISYLLTEINLTHLKYLLKDERGED